MTLVSPGRHVLRRLEGNAGDVARHGRDLVEAGAVMQRTAVQLRRISEGTRQIAQSVDAVREAAGETYPDLEKAATRYSRTGSVLRTYSDALETAQLRIHPLIEQIETAHADAERTRAAQDEADRVVRDNATTMPWETEVSDADRRTALGDQADAATAASSAEAHLEALWGTFDRHFSTWSDAYDAAVDGIEDAFDAADNNDAWGEDLLPILGWIAVGLAVVALFLTGPIALLIAAIGLAIGLMMVAINLLKYAKGRGNWLDLTLSIIGIIPFARPLITGARGGVAAVRTTSALFSSGRGILRGSIRSTLPRYSYVPMSGGPFRLIASGTRNLAAGAGNVYQSGVAAARTVALMGRFRIHDLFISRPIANVWRGGHNSVTSFSQYLLREGSRAGDDALAWAGSSQVAAQAPTRIAEIASRFEAGAVWLINGDFMANALSPSYSEARAGATG